MATNNRFYTTWGYTFPRGIGTGTTTTTGSGWTTTGTTFELRAEDLELYHIWADDDCLPKKKKKTRYFIRGNELCMEEED